MNKLKVLQEGLLKHGIGKCSAEKYKSGEYRTGKYKTGKHRIGKLLGQGFAAACMAVLAVSVVGAFFGASFGAVKVQAAPYETTYKVMIYSGDKGTFNGTACVSGAGEATLQSPDTIVVSGLHYGDTLNIRVSSTNGTINLNSEDGGKYQPTGTRRSGRDNSEAFDQENATSPSRAYTVTSDRTFVVTYGVPGNMVPYTVNYVLAGTNTPLPGSEAQTFYGVAGEKPVVSAPYFEGYSPVYKAITGTLKKGQENTWTFEYTRDTQQTTPAPAAPTAAPQSPSQTTQTTQLQTTTTTQGGTDETETDEGTEGEGETGEGDAENADTEGGEGGTAEEGGAEGGTAGDTESIDDEETPAGLLDLDDEEVPTGNMDLGEGEEESQEASAEPTKAKSLPMFAGIGVVASILLLVLAILLVKKKKLLFKK